MKIARKIRSWAAHNATKIVNVISVLVMAAVPTIGLASALHDSARRSIYEHHYKAGFIVGARFYDLTGASKHPVGDPPGRAIKLLAGHVDVDGAQANGYTDATVWYTGTARDLKQFEPDHYMVETVEGNTAIVTAYRGGWNIRYRVVRVPGMTAGHYATVNRKHEVLT